MKTQIATALASGTAGAACSQLADDLGRQLGGADPALVLAFASTQQPLEQVTQALLARFPRSTVLGASTAGEFNQHGDAKGSISAFAVAGDFQVFAGMGRGLKAEPERAVGEAVAGIPERVPGYAHRTALVLLDALSGSSEETALLVATLLGGDLPMAGGAAGDDLQMKAPYVACGPQVASDAVVVATIFSHAPLGIGVSHGHEVLSRPLKITRASGATVHEIEGRPAWEVWLEQTRERAPAAGFSVASLEPEQVTPFLLHFEAGLSTGTGYKIRAPLSKNDDGSINFACGIAEGSVIRITESEAARQVQSATQAARKAREALHGKKVAGAVVFDCICRNLILGPSFANAVRGISSELGQVPIAGFETYGEIALQVGEMSGFHNTTSVVLAFPES